MAVVGVNVLGDHPQRHPLDLAIRRAMARSAEELCPWTQPSYTSPPFSGLNLYEKKVAQRGGGACALLLASQIWPEADWRDTCCQAG